MSDASTSRDLVTAQMETSAAALRVRSAYWLAKGNPAEAKLLTDLAERLEGWADQRRRLDALAAGA